MKIIIQRSKEASVLIKDKIYNKISYGLVLLVGFKNGDGEKEIDYCIQKIINLRIFDDENGVMNKSIQEINGEILSISQFTLYATTKKGNRPSYINALNAHDANALYNTFNKKLNEYIKTKTGIFGEEMQINIKNDGPTTIILDTDN